MIEIKSIIQYLINLFNKKLQELQSSLVDVFQFRGIHNKKKIVVKNSTDVHLNTSDRDGADLDLDEINSDLHMSNSHNLSLQHVIMGDRSKNHEDLPYRETKMQPKHFPKFAKKILEEWFKNHQNDPYPSEEDKIVLASMTNLTQRQINNWFCNYRGRRWDTKKNKSSFSLHFKRKLKNEKLKMKSV